MKILSVCIFFAFSSIGSAVELTERHAIDLFMEKNLEVSANKYNIEVNKAEELTAGLWANPSILIDTQLNPFGKDWNQKNAGGPTQQDITLTVPIDINGNHRQAVKVARLATKSSEAEFQAFMRENLYGMLDTLYKVQRLEREHELLQEKVQILDKLIITLEKRIGSASNQPLLQSRAKLANEDVKIEIQQNLIEQQTEENKLRTYLLLGLDEEIKLNINLKTHYADNLHVGNLVEYAEKHRPDFLALKYFHHQMKEQVDLERREIWDDFAILAGVSKQDKLNARPGDINSQKLPSAWSWMIGITVPLPVFDRHQGRVLQTRLRSNQALVREKFMKETLAKDISTSITKIELTNKNLHRYKDNQLANAKTVRDSALRQFGTGSTTLIEYLDAINAYHTTISKYIMAQYDLTSEVMKLKLISGKEMIE
jgi:cobalt-zinc-cadmium efflux system outer membrane protein